MAYTKRCGQCAEIKTANNFRRDCDSPDRLMTKCRDCLRARDTLYTKLNSDRARRRASLWYAENRSYVSEKTATKRQVDAIWTAKRAEYDREYYQKIRHRDAARRNAIGARWRAVKRNATPEWLSAVQLAQVDELYEIALARGVQTGIPHEVDHIHPLAGKNFHGLHVPWNLQVITAAQNQKKSNRLLHLGLV